jgi:Tol biopolymer transport system component
VRQLTIDVRSRSPNWSQDGDRIAFYSARDDLPGIFVINVDGTNEQRLTANTISTDLFPVWSPDGSKIAFTRFDGKTGDIYTVNSDGTNLTRLMGPNDAFSNWKLYWSPDGSKMAFTSSRDRNQDVYVMDADGGNLTRLTINDTVYDEMACWLLILGDEDRGNERLSRWVEERD